MEKASNTVHLFSSSMVNSFHHQSAHRFFFAPFDLRHRRNRSIHLRRSLIAIWLNFCFKIQVMSIALQILCHFCRSASTGLREKSRGPARSDRKKLSSKRKSIFHFGPDNMGNYKILFSRAKNCPTFTTSTIFFLSGGSLVIPTWCKQKSCE